MKKFPAGPKKVSEHATVARRKQNHFAGRKGRNQLPKGKMWSAVPLPCFDITISKQGSGPKGDEVL